MSDCGCDAIKTDLIPYEDALQLMLQNATTREEPEEVRLEDALGRVLAESVLSTVNVPPMANSAMDGYAVRSADINGDTTLPVSQRIPAGVTGTPLQAGTAARIFTGAPVPEGADAIVMQELTRANDDGSILVQHTPKAGEHVRGIGEDIAQGASILSPGLRLRPQDLGLAASVGIGNLKVHRRLKVATFYTGDELVDPGKPLQAGQIYNSNQYTTNALLHALGCEVINLGICEDTLQATRDTLKAAAGQADLVITSGGVSVGEEDHVRIALEELGQLNMWKIRIKPGKPLAYGSVEGAHFVGLPGNPVSAFVTFLLFVRPFILKLQGHNEVLPGEIELPADFTWPRAGRRLEFVRARLEHNEQGQAVVRTYPHQGSGVLSSTSWANGLAVIPEGITVAPGDPVKFISYSELL